MRCERRDRGGGGVIIVDWDRPGKLGVREGTGGGGGVIIVDWDRPGK